MVSSVHTYQHSFDRVELSESDYQALLRSMAPRLFPTFKWFFFNPPVESPYGVAHPDAALISESGDDWWVVEVELARHGLADHVDLQLRKLRDGWYGRKHFDHILDRYPEAAPLLAKVDPKRPQFLVIVDDRSTLIERSARDHEFDLLHVLPFRSADQSGPLLYATCVEGRNPLHRTRRSSGITVVAEPAGAAARIRATQVDAKPIPPATSKVLVGNRLVRAWVETDQASVVLALDLEELRNLLGSGPYYWLTSESVEVGRLSTID